ncbi:MAG: hypothetical protein HPM95_03855 [Alphaproteobacteria bacterium]|nr:hypothetical protein [Alphaproteobacteria bacterium]
MVDLERVRGVDLAIRYSPRGSTAGELLARECFRAFAAPSVAIKGRGDMSPPLLVSRWQSSDLDHIPLRPFEAAFGLPSERSPVIFDDEHHAALAAVSGSGIVILSDVLGQDMVASGLLAELSGRMRAGTLLPFASRRAFGGRKGRRASDPVAA